MSLPDDPLFNCLSGDPGKLRTLLFWLMQDVAAVLEPLGCFRLDPNTTATRFQLNEHGGAAVLRWDEPMGLRSGSEMGRAVLRIRLLAMGPWDNEPLRGRGWLHAELEPGEGRTGSFLPGRESLWVQRELRRFDTCPALTEAALASTGLAREGAAVLRLAKWFTDGIEKAREELDTSLFEREVCEALAP